MQIFGYLELKDVKKLPFVSKNFNRVTQNDFVWRRFVDLQRLPPHFSPKDIRKYPIALNEKEQFNYFNRRSLLPLRDLPILILSIFVSLIAIKNMSSLIRGFIQNPILNSFFHTYLYMCFAANFLGIMNYHLCEKKAFPTFSPQNLFHLLTIGSREQTRPLFPDDNLLRILYRHPTLIELDEVAFKALTLLQIVDDNDIRLIMRKNTRQPLSFGLITTNRVDTFFIDTYDTKNLPLLGGLLQRLNELQRLAGDAPEDGLNAELKQKLIDVSSQTLFSHQDILEMKTFYANHNIILQELIKNEKYHLNLETIISNQKIDSQLIRELMKALAPEPPMHPMVFGMVFMAYLTNIFFIPYAWGLVGKFQPAFHLKLALAPSILIAVGALSDRFSRNVSKYFAANRQETFSCKAPTFLIGKIAYLVLEKNIKQMKIIQECHLRSNTGI